jgi:hypothetical protein
VFTHIFTIGTKKKWPYKTGDLLEEIMKFSMTGEEKLNIVLSIIYWNNCMLKFHEINIA